MSNITKADRLLAALRTGKKITADQAVARFKFSSTSSVTGTICHLRRKGFNIVSTFQKNKPTRYSMPAAW